MTLPSPKEEIKEVPKERTIQELSEIELKAICYDESVKIQTSQQIINTISAELRKRSSSS